MARVETRTALGVAAERLRTIVLDADDGAFIGSEDVLIAQMGCSRSTVRQVARLLEREGLLKVRRGINGGYFGTRPDAGTIEATVSAYLETLDMDASDVTVLASTLWVEAVRKAAGAPADARREAVVRLTKLITRVSDEAGFEAIRDLELASQAEVFKLANSAYIQLIFDINVAFSRRRFPASRIAEDVDANHGEFVRIWREAKLLELNAIGIGDHELAVLAARYSRKVWHKRVWRRFAFANDLELSR
jgi:GntR family transcriptional repressor for pyruvate dehydrogenase complex